MDRTERFYKILSLLNARRSVSKAQFIDALEVSPATFKRDLEYLRDRLNAPIEWDRSAGGYRFATSSEVVQLPGVWLAADALYALLLAEVLVRELEPGLLAETLAPIRGQIDSLLEESGGGGAELERRLRILSIGAREVRGPVLAAVLRALGERRQLTLVHFGRARGVRTTRTVSPQRLVRYRDNWYLDAWCHAKQALRTFAADSIESAEVADEAAREVAEAELDRELKSGFGIFSGREVHWARLRFNPERARWVAQEKWHPQQKGGFGKEGEYLLEVPYSEDHELVMEILKFGPDCRVLGPAALKRRVAAAARAVASMYGDADGG